MKMKAHFLAFFPIIASFKEEGPLLVDVCCLPISPTLAREAMLKHHDKKVGANKEKLLDELRTSNSFK